MRQISSLVLVRKFLIGWFNIPFLGKLQLSLSIDLLMLDLAWATIFGSCCLVFNVNYKKYTFAHSEVKIYFHIVYSISTHARFIVSQILWNILSKRSMGESFVICGLFWIPKKMRQSHKCEMGSLFFIISPFPPQLRLCWWSDIWRAPGLVARGSNHQ